MRWVCKQLWDTTEKKVSMGNSNNHRIFGCAEKASLIKDAGDLPLQRAPLCQSEMKIRTLR